MNPWELALLSVAIAVVAATAGWVWRDARARGLSVRKALTWALLSAQEWPLFLLLYRRVRPRRRRRERPSAPA